MKHIKKFENSDIVMDLMEVRNQIMKLGILLFVFLSIHL